MKKFLLLFALLNLIHSPVFSQLTKIDSLEALLQKDKEDTSKVNHLNQLAAELMNNNPDTSILLGKMALHLAENLKWKKGMANSYYRIGSCYYLKGDYKTALDYGTKSDSLYTVMNDKIAKSLCFVLIGVSYLNLGNFPGALGFYSKALQIEEELGNKERIAVILGNIGVVYNLQGDFLQAIDYYFKALKITEELGNKKGSARHLTNIGLIYSNQKDYAKSLDYYFRALRIQEELGNKTGIAVLLGNIAIIYDDQGDYPHARDYYEKAFKMDLEVGNKTGVARHLGNLGNLYNRQGDFPKALEYIFKALKITEEQGDKRLTAIWLGSIGGIYAKTGKFREAEMKLKAAIAILDSIGAKDYLREYEESLSHLYDTTGRYELALVHYKKAMVLKDTLFNQEKNKEITQKEMNYEFEKKDALAKAEQEKKDFIVQKELQKQKLVRNGFVAGFVAVFLFAGVFFIQRNRIKKGKRQSDELLLNILPSEVAEELKAKGSADAKQFDEVTVMFTDFKNFTQISEKLSPTELVAEIDYCFKEFDTIVSKHNIEKIKTIGDSYMCAGGLPVANKTHPSDVVSAGLEIQQFISERFRRSMEEGKERLEIRIGIHTGPVVAGIVGVKKFAYDIWGDTVNIASRMESSSEAGKVNISGTTCELVKDKFNCSYRGKIPAKNKGEIDMYFVESIS